ncbi:MAG: hypothetical protein PUF07_04780, partial [Bacteroidales bacterium]|nr:hypothetical protein [Bacteroidales bacterium]
SDIVIDTHVEFPTFKKPMDKASMTLLDNVETQSPKRTATATLRVKQNLFLQIDDKRDRRCKNRHNT